MIGDILAVVYGGLLALANVKISFVTIVITFFVVNICFLINKVEVLQ